MAYRYVVLNDGGVFRIFVECMDEDYVYNRQLVKPGITFGYLYLVQENYKMKGAMINKGFKYYTFLDEIFPAFENDQLRYNWLITDMECNYYPDDRLITDKKYIWLSGKELTDIVTHNKIQFIWGVLSAFEQSVTLEQVLRYELPFADGYTGFWHNPISIQNPLAEIELVPWDSGLVLLISKSDALVNKFMTFFPQSEDLATVNATST